MKKQLGFGIMQIFLVVGLIIVIISVGVYVYRVKNVKPFINAFDNQDRDKSEKKEESKANEEDSWLTYTPENKAYSIKIPDGWDGVSLYSNFYVMDPIKMVYKKGTKAKVEHLTEGGWDGFTPFSIINPGIYHEEIVRQGSQIGTITTSNNISAQKYSYIHTKDPLNEDNFGPVEGTKMYSYYFGKEGKYIQIIYQIQPGEPDQSQTVERMIKTLIIN